MDNHTAEYYSVIKRNTILPFAAKGITWRALHLVKQIIEKD